MPTLHDKSLRAALQACPDKLEALRKAGKVPPELDTLLQALMPLLTLLLTVLLAKTTRKTSRNCSIPPAQMEAEDDTARRAQSGRKANPAADRSGSTLQRVTSEETLTVAACDSCGADLSDVAASERERRVLYDIVFPVVEQRVTAEVKQCPHCQARCQPAFPASMPGPRQYGSGLQAFLSHLLVAQMLALRRVVELLRAISGLRLSEATCLGYSRRLQQALQAWQQAASAHLLAAPAWHADETGLRVDRQNHGLHILTAGSLTLQFLHPKRGKAAIEASGLLPS